MTGEQRSPVECSSEWVGCGISVRAHPARSSCAPSGERACRPHRKTLFFPVCQRRRQGTDWNSGPAQATASPFDMRADNCGMMWRNRKHRSFSGIFFGPGISLSHLTLWFNATVINYNNENLQQSLLSWHFWKVVQLPRRVWHRRSRTQIKNRVSNTVVLSKCRCNHWKVTLPKVCLESWLCWVAKGSFTARVNQWLKSLKVCRVHGLSDTNLWCPVSTLKRSCFHVLRCSEDMLDAAALKHFIGIFWLLLLLSRASCRKLQLVVRGFADEWHVA